MRATPFILCGLCTATGCTPAPSAVPPAGSGPVSEPAPKREGPSSGAAERPPGARPEPSASVPSRPLVPDRAPECKRAGCSGELCLEAGAEAPLTACVYKPEYECFQEAECKPQADGRCGWEQTPELARCVSQARGR